VSKTDQENEHEFESNSRIGEWYLAWMHRHKKVPFLLMIALLIGIVAILADIVTTVFYGGNILIAWCILAGLVVFILIILALQIKADNVARTRMMREMCPGCKKLYVTYLREFE
jgi:uncharacterized membrane-anchored protein